MKYSAKLIVPQFLFDKMKRLCTEYEPEGSRPFDENIQFNHNFMVSIQLCDGGDSYWTQGVLYQRAANEKDWCEIGCTEAAGTGEGIDGDYYIFDGDDEYLVNVVRADFSSLEKCEVEINEPEN